MKTFVLTLSIMSFFSITAFSQTHRNNTTKQNLDMNGAPLKNVSVQLNVPYSIPNVMTAYSYDSVRALSEINDPNNADAYPWISLDGLRLYYTSGANGNQLMFTQRANTNSYFVTPTVVPISVPDAYSYWLSTDELDVYISNSYGFYYTHRDAVSLPFNAPVNISLLGIMWYAIIGASLNTAQDVLFLHHNYDGIIEFSRSSATSFTYTRTLPAPSGYSIKPGQLSKDELTFFFGASYNEGLQLLYQMTRATPTDLFDTSTFQQIKGINDSSGYNGQPSMSDSLNWVAFVRATKNSWAADDLFITHKGAISSVFNPGEIQISSSAFPNPSSEYLFIKYKTSSNDLIVLSVFSSEGALVYENVISPSSGKIRIYTKVLKNGLYLYRLSQFESKKTGVGTGIFVVLH